MIRYSERWRHVDLNKKILLLEVGLLVLKKAKNDFLRDGRSIDGGKNKYICSAIFDAGCDLQKSKRLTKQQRAKCLDVSSSLRSNISRILGRNTFVTSWSRRKLNSDAERQDYRHLWMDQMIRDYEQELERLRGSLEAVSKLA